LFCGVSAALIAIQPTWIARGAALLPFFVTGGAWWLLRTSDRWVITFLSAALVLPPLPVQLGDSGPHIAIAVAAVGLLAGLLRSSEWRARIEAVELALPAYVAVLLFSLAPAALYSGPQIAAASLARVLLFGISVYLYFYVAHGPASESQWPAALSTVLAALAVTAAFACVDFYYQLPAPAGFGAQFVWLSSGVYRRAQGVFYEASTLGNLCAGGLVLVAVCLARGWRKTPLLLAASLLFAALLVSFSRASLLNLAASLCALAWIERRRIAWPRLISALSAGILAGIVAMYWAAPHMLEFYFVRLRWTAVFLLEGSTGTFSGRIESWAYLLRFLADHPWHSFFGVGYKTLPYSDFAGKPVVADNAYLSALVETGLVGLAALLLLNYAVLRLSWRAARQADPAARLFGTWIGCFWIGQVIQMLSGDLFTYWRVLPLYFWALGMAVRHSRGPHPE
jgi:O-antigen ligase